MKFVAVFAVALLLRAQDPSFDVESRLVMVPVNVTDAKGRAIDGLDSPDFVILDNGKPQQVAADTFGTGVAPIALVIAVQSSGISAAALAKIQKIGAMIQPLVIGQRGCAALVTFADTVEWRQDCTKNPDALARAFSSIQAGDEKSACMLDAVQESIDRLRMRPKVRRVLLLISESRDRSSKADLESVVVAAQTSGVAVYAATYSAFRTAFTAKPTEGRAPREVKRSDPAKEPQSPRDNERRIPPPEQRVDILGGIGELTRLGKTNTTQVLTGRTGGAAFSFTRQKGLEEAVEKLSSDLHTQYLLSFAPQKPDPGYHQLEVRINRPGEFRVRSRPGYWSSARP